MSLAHPAPMPAARPRWAFHPAMGIVGFVTLLYPFLLNRFHATVGVDDSSGLVAATAVWLAALWLAAAFAVPACCLICALRLASAPIRTTAQRKALRLAYIGVIGPTAYVFMGVLLYMAGSPLPDEAAWTLAWLAVLAWAVWPAKAEAVTTPVPAGASARLRVAHGIAATVILAYVAFHLTNHLFGLVSPEAHARVMAIGRTVYRASFVEPVLVALMLFQIVSGLRLAWRWSGQQVDGYRVFQVASGVYLSIFILGHMDSVFVFARGFLGIDTGWGFATGAPTGLIHDPWNIRLVPHYWLGVFLVLSHLASGLRVVLTAHGVNRSLVFRLWLAGLVAAAIVATVILAGMCGLRLTDLTGCEPAYQSIS